MMHGGRCYAPPSKGPNTRERGCWMDKLHVLGTGNAMVTKLFNTCSVLELSGRYLLVDCGGGNGILQRLEAAGIDQSQIHDVFLSHEHCDHLLGAAWVVRWAAAKIRAGKYEGDLRIYCHAALAEKVKTLCELCLQKKFTALFGQRIHLIPVADGEEKIILGRPFTFFDILSEKAPQYGFTLHLENGGTLCFMGDEPVNPKREHYAQNARWLLCEAFCLQRDAERFKPYEKHHSTAADAAKLAQRLGVGNLLLWHTEQATQPARKALYTEEAAQYFSGAIYVPEDLEVLALTE